MSNWLLGLPGASRKRKPEEDAEEDEEEEFDETACRRYLGGALLARETVPQALKYRCLASPSWADSALVAGG